MAFCIRSVIRINLYYIELFFAGGLNLWPFKNVIKQPFSVSFRTQAIYKKEERGKKCCNSHEGDSKVYRLNLFEGFQGDGIFFFPYPAWDYEHCNMNRSLDQSQSFSELLRQIHDTLPFNETLSKFNRL